MSIDVLHHGGAVRWRGATRRLKDLLGAEALGGGGLRILSADDRADGLSLQLSDGSSRTISPTPTDVDLVVRNAGQILTMEGEGVGLVDGGSVLCRAGEIVAVSADGSAAADSGARVVDARGGVVAPGLVDPHTHPVFAGERSLEFAMKAAGRTYLEIHRAGGGILSTVQATRAASFDELARVCARNLSRLLSWGVTTCEAKSGYALDVAGELRLLEVLRTVGDCHPVDVEPTLLGAHAVPPEMTNRRAEYVALVSEEMVPRAARESLARYCDAYCEEGAFTVAEVERIFAAARAAGLGLRLHAEQFSDQGGAQLAVRERAASADHLEALGPEAVSALGRSSTVAVLLPGAALACRCPWPPARALLDAGAQVALGTDLNPGSSMTAALPLMMSLACMQMKMTCEEAWRAVTCVAARSLGRADIGRIAVGARADFVIFDVPDYRYVPYHYGENHAAVVIKAGRVAWSRC
jgi:imidazolonepropionase